MAINLNDKSFEELTTEELQALAYDREELHAVLNAYDTAVEDNNDRAMTYLGIVYWQTLDNPEKSVYWLNKSAELGNIESMFLLGRFYMEGYGVEYDKIKGTDMIIMSAQKGCKSAVECLKNNYHLTDEQIKDLGVAVE